MISTEMQCFTSATTSGYHSSRAGKNTGAGIGVPCAAAKSRQVQAARLFSRHGASSFGRPGGRGRKARRCRTGTPTPVSVAHPIGVRWAVQNRLRSTTTMSTPVQVTPRRRGRPRKTQSPVINPRFPGTVIPITSVPRLRVGAICEVIDQKDECALNNGRRVVIKAILDDGRFHIVAVDGPLFISDGPGRCVEGMEGVAPSASLYRIGHVKEPRHD